MPGLKMFNVQIVAGLHFVKFNEMNCMLYTKLTAHVHIHV